MRHEDLIYHFISELIEENKLIFEYTVTNSAWVDSLTKALPHNKSDACCENSGL